MASPSPALLPVAGLSDWDDITNCGSGVRVLADNLGVFREEQMGLKNFEEEEKKEDEEGKWEVGAGFVVVKRQAEEIESNSIFRDSIESWAKGFRGLTPVYYLQEK